jgi:glycosyltransferase involved in cell wall biosynthesis
MSDDEIRITSAQISDALPPVLDGVVHTVVNYAQMINRYYGTAYTIGPRVKGHESDERDIRCRSIPIPRSHPYRLMLPWTDRTFLRAIDRLPLDIVHAHSPFGSGAIAERIARRQGIPLVTTLHSKYKDDFMKYVHSENIADMLVRRVSRFYRRADDVWVPNQATGQTLRDYGYEGPYHVMYNGVDFAPVDAQEKEELSNRARELFDIPSGVHVMSFVGQQSWKKNLAFTIEALTFLARQRKDFLMIFVGEGPDKRAIIELTRKRGISSNVQFVGKLSERSHVKAVYALSDLFLFPSIYDTDSLVVKEAAACRTPSVFLEGTHAAAPIRNDDNGFIISPDPMDYALRLHNLLNQPEFTRKVGDRAMETLYRSWETVAAEVVQRYRELIEEHGKVNKTQS